MSGGAGSGLHKTESLICYGLLASVTVVGIFTDKIPIQLNIVIHSMAIIAIGSFKSLEEFIK